jgi:integrase
LLVLGLRKGELLGLAWIDVDLDAGELTVGWQLQRIHDRLLRRPTKTENSDATLPLPEICVTALRRHRIGRDAVRRAAGIAWHESSDLHNPTSTSTLGWPCRFCGTPNSPSPWIYTQVSSLQTRDAP